MTTTATEKPPQEEKSPLKRLYHWVLGWGDHPLGLWALVLLAFTESIFFPIPPDVLLIALALGRREKWWHYAAWTTGASALGGACGYALGVWMLEPVCLPIIDALGLQHGFAQTSQWFREYDVWAVGLAGFSPIPYKVFTISAGISRLEFGPFLLTSLISRGARFFLVAYLLYRFGDRAKDFVEVHLNRLALAFAVLLIGGFVAMASLSDQGTPNVDWEKTDGLLEGMRAAEFETRSEAVIELRMTTGHYEAYRPEASEEERTRAIERWVAWIEETKGS